jgi:hypothetical protein
MFPLSVVQVAQIVEAVKIVKQLFLFSKLGILSSVLCRLTLCSMLHALCFPWIRRYRNFQ